MKQTLFVLALVAMILAPLSTARTLDVEGHCLLEDANVYVNGQADHDGDGVPSTIDNCACVHNSDQRDSDLDGVGDACEIDVCIPTAEICDSKDNDCDLLVDEGGVCTSEPVEKPSAPQTLCEGIEPMWVNGQLDSDRDGVPDTLDNCQCVGNVAQTDTDNNGIGDACVGDPTEIPEFGSILAVATIGLIGTALVMRRRK
jgi:hypothetical protein